jgi:hypothetical protein
MKKEQEPMSIPNNIQAELEKRDELILALEMLTVDQACRLLALEAVVINMADAGNVKPAGIKARIARETKRFQQHFEGDGLSGFIARAERIAGEIASSAKGGPAAKTAKKKPAKAPVKKAAAAKAKKPAATKAKKPAAAAKKAKPKAKKAK